MISSLGNLTLWLSLFFALLQFIIFIRKKHFLSSKLIKIIPSALLICSFISFISLIYSYVISDFTLINVFENSHTTKPLVYKITAVWGNHEGSMLLWLLVMNFNSLRLSEVAWPGNQFKFITESLIVLVI